MTFSWKIPVITLVSLPHGLLQQPLAQFSCWNSLTQRDSTHSPQKQAARFLSGCLSWMDGCLSPEDSKWRLQSPPSSPWQSITQLKSNLPLIPHPYSLQTRAAVSKATPGNIPMCTQVREAGTEAVQQNTFINLFTHLVLFFVFFLQGGNSQEQLEYVF